MLEPERRPRRPALTSRGPCRSAARAAVARGFLPPRGAGASSSARPRRATSIRSRSSGLASWKRSHQRADLLRRVRRRGAQREEVVAGAEARVLEQPVGPVAAALQEARLQQPQLLHGRRRSGAGWRACRAAGRAPRASPSAAPGSAGSPCVLELLPGSSPPAPRAARRAGRRATRACRRRGARRSRAAPPSRRGRCRDPRARCRAAAAGRGAAPARAARARTPPRCPRSSSFRISSNRRACGTFSQQVLQLA